jgi:predicted Zn-dependent peptidase
MGQHYRLPRLVVSAAGNVDHDAFVQMAGDAFGNLGSVDESDHDPARYGGGEIREKRDLEQVHLTMAFPSLAFDHPDFYAVQVLSTVLGGGMSSRLFQEVREKRGLAYSVFSFAQSYLDTGMFGVYAGTGEGQVAELAQVVADQVCQVSHDITDEETARARAQHKAGVLMGLESSAARCEQMARQLLIFDRPISSAELIANVDAVDAPALRRIAAETITAGPLSLAVVGPLGGLESYDALAAKFD